MAPGCRVGWTCNRGSGARCGMRPYTAWSADGRSVEVEHPNPRRRFDERIRQNEYGCPEYIYRLLTGDFELAWASPILRVVRRLGPSRCQWVGYPPTQGNRGALSTRTCWALDGRRASLRDFYKTTEIGGPVTAGGVDASSLPTGSASAPTSSPRPAVEGGPSALTGHTSPRREASLKLGGGLNNSARPHPFSGGNQ